ncbi:hypothetical protein ACHRVZ_19520 [Flavobacterium sp. FlaQc-57]|uniref:hypothetical protein n=1 Tax=Flavobacterium sp. FlaQc-57 TaxID=3374186 RepID=UPI0037584BE1
MKKLLLIVLLAVGFEMNAQISEVVKPIKKTAVLAKSVGISWFESGTAYIYFPNTSVSISDTWYVDTNSEEIENLYNEIAKRLNGELSEFEFKDSKGQYTIFKFSKSFGIPMVQAIRSTSVSGYIKLSGSYNKKSIDKIFGKVN